MRKRNRGFTLIEVIVVIAIMAMTMGIAIGIIGDNFDRQAKRETARLAGAVRFAYHASVSGHVPHRLVFDLTEGKYWVEVSTAAEEAPVV
ncbi:MAG: type II secretion system protein, partial [Deltaproteobacteria bacterium]|nr:type II secretion system protein [Deltaproteobacteria bacterium]